MFLQSPICFKKSLKVIIKSLKNSSPPAKMERTSLHHVVEQIKPKLQRTLFERHWKKFTQGFKLKNDKFIYFSYIDFMCTKFFVHPLKTHKST